MSLRFGRGCVAFAVDLLAKTVYILSSVNLYFVTFMNDKVLMAASAGGELFGEWGAADSIRNRSNLNSLNFFTLVFWSVTANSASPDTLAAVPTLLAAVTFNSLLF